jgi:hypothetical protein
MGRTSTMNFTITNPRVRFRMGEGNHGGPAL